MPLSYLRFFRDLQILGHNQCWLLLACLPLLPLLPPLTMLALNHAASASATVALHCLKYPEVLSVESLCTLLCFMGLSTPPLFCLVSLKDDFKPRLHLSGILPELPFWITYLPSWPLPHFIYAYPPLECKLFGSKILYLFNFVLSEYNTKIISEMIVK